MIAIFDLDGTLALNEHRQHFLKETPKNWKAFHEACVGDLPNVPVIKLFKQIVSMSSNQVFILSGRSNEVRAQTESWLDNYIGSIYIGLPNVQLAMRKKGDFRDDREVKKDMFLELQDDLIKRHGSVLYSNFIIFDDRQKVVDMWREMGLVCCQVAPGDF